MARPLNDVTQLRSVEERVSELAIGEFRQFVKKVDWTKTKDNSAVLAALTKAAVIRIINRYALMEAMLAADFYDESRVAAGVKGFYRAKTQPAPATEGIEQQVGYAARWLFGKTPQPSKMFNFIEGEIDKKVKAAYRDTIAVSAEQDPAQPRLRRSIAGTCNFCKTLAHRDYSMAVRGADRSKVNQYHPGCKCVPVAVWVSGETGTVNGRFSGTLDKIYANLETVAEWVDVTPRQFYGGLATPPAAEHLAPFRAPVDAPWKYFTPSERAIAEKLQHAYSVKVESINHVAYQQYLQRNGLTVSEKAPEAFFAGTDITVEFKTISPTATNVASAINNRLRGAREQSRNVIIDCSGVGVDAATARRAIARMIKTYGDDFDSIVVLLGDGWVLLSHGNLR
jgi:hypothetical protein